MEKLNRFKIGLTLAVITVLLLCTACSDTDFSYSNAKTADGTQPAGSNVVSNIANRVIAPDPTDTPEISATPTPAAIIAATPTPGNASNKANNSTASTAPTATPTKAPLAAPYPVTSPTPIPFSGKGITLDRKFHSPVLDRDMPYRIYLPPNYATSGKNYPVLYMLHGLSGAYDEWVDYKIFETTDDLINRGVIKPIIVVLPSGDQEYWVDHANGGPQYGLYVAHDVVGHIDATYRTLPNRENRAIGGHSMGGQGSLQIAFNYPQVFGTVGAHSPTLRTKDQAPAYFGDEAFYEAHDPVSIAKTSNVLTTLRIWVDIGTLDSEWRPRAEELNDVLNSRGIPHEWHLWEGDHGGDYWTAHLPQYLQFYTDGMPGK